LPKPSPKPKIIRKYITTLYNFPSSFPQADHKQKTGEMPIFRAFSLFYLGFGERVKKGGEGEIGRFREILAKKITICLPQGKKVGKHNQKKRGL
jgi:hypothetical protein